MLKNLSKTRKNNSKELGLTVLAELLPSAHSRVRSHYCATRRLLPAGFLPWAGASLLRRPGGAGLLPHPHIDAGLSADT